MSKWQEHIESLLIPSYKRIPTGSHGDTICETYKPVDKGNQTIIKLGYLTNGGLIYLKFENPKTPGFTEQQNREYFYRFDFDPTNSYGPPGLQFNDLNISAVDNLLKNGLNGREIQYFSNGQLVKSEVYYSYGATEPTEFATTINFRRMNFKNMILSIFKKSNEKTSTIEIQLNEIFGGITTP